MALKSAAVLVPLASLALCVSALAQPQHFRDGDFRRQDLSRQHFQSQDFSRANFEGADLGFADFSRSILKNANLRGANLKLTQFREADLTEADLRDASLAGVNFNGAKLIRANLSGATLYLAGSAAPIDNSALDKLDDKEKRDIQNKRRDAMDTMSMRTNLDTSNGNLTFRGAILRNAQIFGNLANVDFRDADLRGADLGKAENQQEAIFTGAIYDKNTRWRVNPQTVGAVRRDD